MTDKGRQCVNTILRLLIIYALRNSQKTILDFLYNLYMPIVIWITGWPGSGKSTVASAVKDLIPDAAILRMDELRNIVTPEPTYSDSQRECVYRSLVYTAKIL